MRSVTKEEIQANVVVAPVMRMIVNDRWFEDHKEGIVCLAKMAEDDFVEVILMGYGFQGESVEVMDDLIDTFGFATFFP